MDSPDPPATPESLEAPTRWPGWVLGAGLVLAVLVVGSSDLNAPWLIGDEHIFLVDHADVNPGAAPGGAAPPLAARLGRIFTQIHEDLYQPIPLATYALEWQLTGGSPASIRRSDLLLHAANALLLWWVLASFLGRAAAPAGTRSSGSDVAALPPAPLTFPVALAWGLALIWAVHPALASAYAADMGRTHLLAALFALLALRLHLRALQHGRDRWFSLATVALVLAMFCKPLPGWVLVGFVLEAAYFGWRGAARSHRFWVIACVCGFFAWLTIWTSTRSGLAADAARGVFGDPAARALTNIWLYTRHVVVPLDLAPAYLPDPHTGWGRPEVWMGLGIVVLAAAHAAWSWRRGARRSATLGWCWWAALLLPVSGLLGARETIADRYMYQPLMGLLLVLGVVVLPLARRVRRPALLPRASVVAAVLVALPLAAWSLDHTAILRGTVSRAQRIAQQAPEDPRALEGLAVAFDFATNHPLSSADLSGVPAGFAPGAHFRQLWTETLVRTAELGNLDTYYRGDAELAAFHRRLSYRFLRAGDPARSLQHANQARALEPDSYLSWLRTAQALRALGRYDEAAAAYAAGEPRVPENPLTRATYLTEYAALLMYELEQDGEACPRFIAALQTGVAPPQAKSGLALCEIRYGKGETGFRLVSEALEQDPTDVQAGHVLAEFHLRSHHWEQAATVYRALLDDHPTDYRALRGYLEVCQQTGRLDESRVAWLEALRREPHRREFQSYLVWVLALARDPDVQTAAEALLVRDADNPLACLALALAAARENRFEIATDWVRRGTRGVPIPKARAFERAAAAFQLRLGGGELPPAAAIVHAEIVLRGGLGQGPRDFAAGTLRPLAGDTTRPYAALARELLAQLSDAEPRPDADNP